MPFQRERAIGKEKMFTVKEVAERLNLTVRAIYRAVENGDIDHYRFGSRIRISESQVETFVDKALIKSQAATPPTLSELIRKHLGA